MRNYNMAGQMEKPCGCMPEVPYAREDDFVVAMAYVPWQHFTTVYEPDKALEVGTIFPELNLPFYGGKRGMRR